jgi:hypothetical protein
MRLGVIKKAAVCGHEVVFAAYNFRSRLGRVHYGVPVTALIVDGLGIPLKTSAGFS